MKSIFYLLLIIVSGVNLVFAPCTVTPFDISKITWVAILTSVIIIIWAVDVLKWNEFVGFRKTQSLNLSILIYICICALSVGLSEDWLVNLMGSYKRHDGLISLMLYFSLFYISVKFVNKFNIEYLINTLILTGVVISIYGLMQTHGLYIFNFRIQSYRIYSTLGNPVFFSAFLAMVIPLTYYRLLSRESTTLTRILCVCAIALFMLNLCNTGARSGLIAMVISTIVFVYFYDKRDPIYIICSGLVIFTAICIAWIDSGNTYLRLDITNISPRIDIYKKIIPVIKSNWIFGVGNEGLYSILYSEGHTTERAHNELSQQLVSYGVFGLGAYIFMVKCFCCDVWKRYKSTDNKLLVNSLFASCLAYIIFIQFNPTSVAINTTFYILMGSIYGSKNYC